MQQLSICRVLAPFGIVRLLGVANGFVAKYSPTERPAATALFNQTRQCYTSYDELVAFDESFARVRAVRHPLGHLPLVVLTHGIPQFPDAQGEQEWQALQRDLAGLSTNSEHIIAIHSGHYIQLDQPDLVIVAIKQVLTGKV
jgi:hypothetical protein